jgi:hypothetical protein
MCRAHLSEHGGTGLHRLGLRGRKPFFSEEKNQKTFIFSAASMFPAMAGKLPLAQN